MQIQKQFDNPLYYSIISDSKRQQTTTVDYKRLFNGLLLTDNVSLQRNNKSNTAMKTYKHLRGILDDITNCDDISIKIVAKALSQFQNKPKNEEK